jgi:CDP-diacylglycerol--serine O-phosphatidyltransferase
MIRRDEGDRVIAFEELDRSVDQPKRRRGRRRLRAISTIPTLLTLGNLICGFAAIYFCMRAMYDAGAGVSAAEFETLHSRVVERLLPSFLAIGGMLVFAGMLFDALDGRVARLTKGTSEFGAELDSLADMVTFGVAPALLMITYMYTQLRAEAFWISPLSEDHLGRAMWMMGAVYAACAAMRLARYNVEAGKKEMATKAFRGLPSPGAAAALASLVILLEKIDLSLPTARVAVWFLPIVAGGLGYLMVSRVRYVHVGNTYLSGRKPFNHVLLVGLGVFALAISWAYTLVIAVWSYVLSGPILVLIRTRRSQESAHSAG